MRVEGLRPCRVVSDVSGQGMQRCRNGWLLLRETAYPSSDGTIRVKNADTRVAIFSEAPAS